jgi:molybdopterin converting factor small subunit
MSVEINLPPVLQALAGGIRKADVTGGTIQDCLEDLIKQYPGLKSRLFRGKLELSRGIEIYVNRVKINPHPLAGIVKDGDKIHVSFIVLGG